MEFKQTYLKQDGGKKKQFYVLKCDQSNELNESKGKLMEGASIKVKNY